jgi:transcriptional regulator with XRE-family HTH domain
VARPPSPTAQHRRLVVELARLREACGMSRQEAAARIGAAAISVFRYEKGLSRPQPAHVAALMDAYGITGARRDELIQFAKDARKRGWWHRHRDTFKPGFDVFIGLEAEAAILRAYEAQVVPGLLQTERYAHAIITATAMGERLHDIDRRMAVRMHRQALLSGPDPVRLNMILDEAALRRTVAGPEAMRDQLLHLVEVSKRPNICLQVLPFGIGAHPAMDTPFVLVEFARPADDALVYVELATSGMIMEGHAEISRYTLIYRQLTALALSPGTSTGFIAELAEGLRRM